jgi:hypothetical protein
MKNAIEASFPNCALNNCHISATGILILICDTSRGHCKIIADQALAHFTIHNPKQKNINIVMVDKCVFADSSHKKCDFIAYDSDCFCFVEIKDTSKRRQVHRSKAAAQLETTIQKFTNKLDLSKHRLEAIICWNFTPRKPAASTLMQSKKLHFLTNYNAHLMEGNEKTF